MRDFSVDKFVSFRCWNCNKLLFRHSAFLPHGVTVRVICPRCNVFVEKTI